MRPKLCSWAAAFVCLSILPACAPKRSFTAVPVPDWDVVETTVVPTPADLSSNERRRFEDGLRDLGAGRLESAASALGALGERYPSNASIATALGFLELRLGSRSAAEGHFRTALRSQPPMGAAQAGYFLAALSAGSEEEAYQRLVRLKREYPQHVLVERHETLLQLNVAESRLRSARELARDARWEEAAQAYLHALEVAPEASGLYLEMAEVELEAELFDRAARHSERAAELEPDDATAYRLMGEAYFAKEDLVNAREAYRRAVSASPYDPELKARLALIEGEFEQKHLPPQYSEIAATRRLTREQLGALLAIELRSALDAVPIDTGVIAIDISESWAADFIRRILGAGLLEVFPNHTFQPHAFVSRIDLARALARALELLAPSVFVEAATESARRSTTFSDLGFENRYYQAAAMSVSLGLLPFSVESGFEPQQLVSGPEAVRAVEALASRVTNVEN